MANTDKIRVEMTVAQLKDALIQLNKYPELEWLYSIFKQKLYRLAEHEQYTKAMKYHSKQAKQQYQEIKKARAEI